MPSQFAFMVALCVPLALSLSNLTADPIRLQSTEDQVVFLELHTSEGCSSCPPAERWLSGLKVRPELWRQLVPVAFHVDYWDALGWKDPFASKKYSDRQRQYANHWQSQSVYTPGFVCGGKEWKGWFRRDRLPLAPPNQVGVLWASSDDGSHWRCTYRPAPSVTASSYEFHAALLGFELTSEVKAGENRGRKLDHDFVVLKLTEAASIKESETFQAILEFDSDLRTAKRFGIAVWITLPNNLEPLQALGGWIATTLTSARIEQAFAHWDSIVALKSVSHVKVLRGGVQPIDLKFQGIDA
jgi:hypothetical protein